MTDRRSLDAHRQWALLVPRIAVSEGAVTTLVKNVMTAALAINETAAEVHSRRRLSVRTCDVTDP